MTEIINEANELIKAYSYFFTFCGFVVGLFGIFVGLYNWLKSQSIIRLREQVIKAHFVNLQSFRGDLVKDKLNTPERLKTAFLPLYKNYLQMISIILNPSKEELERWQTRGYIDPDDYDFLIRMKMD